MQRRGWAQVPRSSKQVAEDGDYLLYRVALFRRVCDSFKAACRTAGYQARRPGAQDLA